MFDCSGEETEFFYDYSGDLNSERLCNISNCNALSNSFLYGGVYLKLTELLDRGDILLWCIFIVLVLLYVVIR